MCFAITLHEESLRSNHMWPSHPIRLCVYLGSVAAWGNGPSPPPPTTPSDGIPPSIHDHDLLVSSLYYRQTTGKALHNIGKDREVRFFLTVSRGP